MKRAIDILGGLAALPALLPLFGVIAAAVFLGSGRPVLFGQIRVGRNFRPFRLWKFRTMRAGPRGAPITVSGDRRVTRVGRFLRSTKLDELPQLWNVLVGDMSLVGPRPEIPEYVEMFRERYRNILSARPGITDPASIRYRNEEHLLGLSENPLDEYAGRVLPAKLDLADEYLKTQTTIGDFAILFRTSIATLRGRL